MRKIVTLSILSVLVTVGIAQANLLSNGDFETQGSYSYFAQSWEWLNPDHHGSAWGTASRESWRAHTGNWEGTIRGSWSGNDNGGWWQEKLATPGATYTLSAWFWADNSWTNQADQGIKIEFYDGTTNAAATLLYAVTNSFGGIGETWVQKTVQATAPTNAIWVRVVVWASTVGASGALQCDDVSLVAEPGTVILLSQLPILFLGVILVSPLKNMLRKHSDHRTE